MESLTPSELTSWLILLLSAPAGGAVNALAGGGMFLVFPAMLIAGISPIVANATATFVLFPGAYASAWVYRDRLIHGKTFQTWMIILSGLGAWVGSELLLHTSAQRFAALVPYLMIGASTIFTFAGKIRSLTATAKNRHMHYPVLLTGQFLIAIYGGYFGAGQGVLMLALMLTASNMDVHDASGIRILCGAVCNTVATAIFVLRGVVAFHYGLPMVVLSITGGYFGAKLVKKMDADKARTAILVYAWVVSIALWIRSFR